MLQRIAVSLALGLFLALALTGRDTIVGAVSEGTVEIQDGAGNVVESVLLDNTVTFFVRDADLATAGTGTGIWTGLEIEAPAGTWWSFATGEPDPAIYVLSADKPYDSGDPASTPLVIPGVLWTATVDGIDTPVTNFSASTGRVTLLTDVEPGSTVEIDFAFDIVDLYSPSDLRVRASSTSDSDGEWGPLAEVVSGSDMAGSPNSGFFAGTMNLSSDPRAAAPTDGAVFARDGESFTVAYFDADGAQLASDSVKVYVSIPKPIPAAGPMTLVGLGLALAVLVAWRWRRLPNGRVRQAH